MTLSFLISLSEPTMIKMPEAGRAHANAAEIETVLHGIAERGAVRWWSDHLSPWSRAPPPP